MPSALWSSDRRLQSSLEKVNWETGRQGCKGRGTLNIGYAKGLLPPFPVQEGKIFLHAGGMDLESDKNSSENLSEYCCSLAFFPPQMRQLGLWSSHVVSHLISASLMTEILGPIVIISGGLPVLIVTLTSFRTWNWIVF